MTIKAILCGILCGVAVCVPYAVAQTAPKAEPQYITTYHRVTWTDDTPKRDAPELSTYHFEKIDFPTEEANYFDVTLSHDLQDHLLAECEKYNVQPELMLALIACESSYRADIVSKTNDYGLCQINKINHDALSKKLGIDDFTDAKQNISAGVYMMADALEKVNRALEPALMVYNLGFGGAKTKFEAGIYSTPYSQKVVNAMLDIEAKPCTE